MLIMLDKEDIDVFCKSRNDFVLFFTLLNALVFKRKPIGQGLGGGHYGVALIIATDRVQQLNP